MIKRTLAILLIVMIFSCNAIFTFAFSDADYHWAKDAIYTLYNKGAIGGFSDNSFKPDNLINVDEFIKIVVSLQGFRNYYNAPYWAAPYINKAKQLEYIKEGEYTDYDRPITRAEMARIVVRALPQESYPTYLAEYTKYITDFQLIPEEYREYVLKAFNKGIITGYMDGTFRHNVNASRGEAATIAVRMLDAAKRKPPEAITHRNMTEYFDCVAGNSAPVNFIEPKFRIAHFYTGSVGYFDIILDNANEYKDTSDAEYRFKITCLNKEVVNYSMKYNESAGFLRQDRWISLDNFMYGLSRHLMWPTGSVSLWNASRAGYRKGTKNKLEELYLKDGMQLEMEIRFASTEYEQVYKKTITVFEK